MAQYAGVREVGRFYGGVTMSLRPIGYFRLCQRRARVRGVFASLSNRGFTIVELLVTLSIVTILMGVLLPGLGSARNGARRTQCSSNLRQIGVGLYLYALHNEEQLPATIFDDDETPSPHEMMALTTGIDATASMGHWDGLGRLVGDSKMYTDSTTVLYCPCHHGDHCEHVYEGEIRRDSPHRIYCNYHFVGDNDHRKDTMRRLWQCGSDVLVTDGMRTASDINHESGANRLRADGSVSYWADTSFLLQATFTQTATDAAPTQDSYDRIWDELSKFEH